MVGHRWCVQMMPFNSCTQTTPRATSTQFQGLGWFLLLGPPLREAVPGDVSIVQAWFTIYRVRCWPSGIAVVLEARDPFAIPS